MTNPVHRIKFPAYLGIRNAKSLIQKCNEAFSSSANTILFDLWICRFSDPFAITLLAGSMRVCVSRGRKVFYKKPRKKVLDQHFNRIGFYKFGKSVVGKSKYAPHQVELQHLTALRPDYTAAVIQVLKGYLNLSRGVQDSLYLSVNELMTNTFDHSKTVVGCFGCAQAWTERGTVGICLTDFGRGILASLLTVTKYSHLKNSVEAIELAILKGVSSRTNILAGLGLDHIHRFLRVNKGQIHIISGDGWVHWNYGNGENVIITRKKLKVAFEGTIVNILARADGEGIYILESETREDQIF